MKLYRIVPLDFSSDEHILSGLGACYDRGGRWNSKGTRTVYTAKHQDVAVAEKGFYEITTRVEEYLNQGASPAHHFFNRIIDQEFTLAEIEASKLEPFDLTKQKTLDYSLKTLELPNYTISDSRKSPYDLLPDRWTQKIGELIRENNFHLVAKSARSDIADNIVLFNKVEHFNKNFKVINKSKIKLSAVDSLGSKISKGKTPVIDKVFFENSGNSKIVNILHFSV